MCAFVVYMTHRSGDSADLGWRSFCTCGCHLCLVAGWVWVYLIWSQWGQLALPPAQVCFMGGNLIAKMACCLCFPVPKLHSGTPSFQRWSPHFYKDGNDQEVVV